MDYIGQYLMMGLGEDPLSFRDDNLDLVLVIGRSSAPPCLLIYKETLKALICRCLDRLASAKTKR